MSNYHSKILRYGGKATSLKSLKRYTLSVSGIGAAYSVSPSKTYYTANDQITITLTAEEGYTVVGTSWNYGNAVGFSGSDGQCSFTLNQNTTISYQAVEIAENTTNFITQYGITWTFDDYYEYGQFCNGDYWVVGPVTLISISPNSFVGDGIISQDDWVVANGRTVNGSMINPLPGSSHGYDSGAYGYNVGLNVAFGISEETPLTIPPNSSLVSSISRNGGVAPLQSQLKTAAVLTVLEEVPPSGSFRPSYCGSDKTIKFNKSILDYTKLKSLPSSETLSSLLYAESLFRKPWIDHQQGWTGRYIHPNENMKEYGRDIQDDVGIGALMLHLNFTNEEKENLLIYYTQLGIDLYGIAINGGKFVWFNDGGHAGGRKWPILFAGLMLDDDDMKAIGEKSGDYLYTSPYGPGNPPSDYIHFGEDDQTFYVAQLDVDLTNGPTFNPDYRDTEKIPYTSNDLGLPEWGIRHSSNPNYSNKWLSTAYRHVVGPGFYGPALAALFMDAKSLWNHNAYFDYTDRYMHFTSSIGEYASSWRSSDHFTITMWDTYRKEYAEEWSPGKYWQGSYVLHNGNTYLCVASEIQSGGYYYTEEEPGVGTDWVLL
jgi:hypothetical protein